MPTSSGEGPASPNFNNYASWDNPVIEGGPPIVDNAPATIYRYCVIEDMNPNNGGTNYGNLDGTNAANDPLVAPMGDYGGPTKTMPPLPGSPAIDPPTGLSSSFPLEQRGAPRLVGAKVDIGAVEIQGPDDHFNITFDLDRYNDGYTDGMEAAIGTPSFGN